MTTIRNIVDEMRQGTAYCEYWQRDWSWTKNHIATLWDSLFKGHPIGLFTFWEQETPEGQVHKLIVDGQQRLLSIYTAMENSLPPTILPNAPAPPLGLHVDVLSGNFRFHTPMMNRRPQWMPVCDIIQDDAAKMEAMEKALRPKRNAEDWRQCVRNIRTIQNIAERHIMVSTIAPEMKLQEVMELFARMQNNGRRVTKDDIETMWMSPKWPAARSTIHDMIAKWQDTPLQKVATKSNIIRVAGILLNGRQQHCGLSRADASPEQIKGAFARGGRLPEHHRDRHGTAPGHQDQERLPHRGPHLDIGPLPADARRRLPDSRGRDQGHGLPADHHAARLPRRLIVQLRQPGTGRPRKREPVAGAAQDLRLPPRAQPDRADALRLPNQDAQPPPHPGGGAADAALTARIGSRATPCATSTPTNWWNTASSPRTCFPSQTSTTT